MASYSFDLTRMMRELEELTQNVAKLHTELQRLSSAQRQDKSELKKLTEKVADEIKSSGERAKQLTSVKKNLDDVQRTTKALAGLTQRKHRELEVLDRRVRQLQSPGAKADVDAWAAGQADLGRQVAEGRKAARRLPDLSGEVLETQIAQHDQNVTSLRRYHKEAVEAARRLTTLESTRSRRAWNTSMRTWSVNRDAAVALANKLPASAAAAHRAQAELTTLPRRHDELRSLAEHGDRALTELRQHVQAYLEAVVAADQVLPMWFDLVLGPGIPRENWPAWLSTGVDVICYRIVYEVSDQLSALGDRPTDDEQRAEHNRLTTACAANRL